MLRDLLRAEGFTVGRKHMTTLMRRMGITALYRKPNTSRKAPGDGKGCWRDNVFIERVWRSIKYEEVYLHAYETVSAAREGIGRYINFYNMRRPHSSHQARTPDVVYFASLPQPSAEAA